MKVVSWSTLSRTKLNSVPPVAVTVGVFDGVHRGHQRLLSTAGRWGRVCVITFRRNPLLTIGDRRFLGDICTPEQKLSLLAEYGVEYTILVDFDSEFRLLPGRRFLETIRTKIPMASMAIGTDFRCGKDLDTGASDILRIMAGHGVRVDIVAPLADNGQSVSSTRIREAIRSGDMDGARRMLGHSFVLDLRNADGYMSGDTYRILRSSIAQVHPSDGVYSGRVASPDTEVHRTIDMAVLPEYIEIHRAHRCEYVEFLNRKPTPSSVRS